MRVIVSAFVVAMVLVMGETAFKGWRQDVAGPPGAGSAWWAIFWATAWAFPAVGAFAVGLWVRRVSTGERPVEVWWWLLRRRRLIWLGDSAGVDRWRRMAADVATSRESTRVETEKAPE